METKDVILQLRNRENLSREELAEKLFVLRYAAGGRNNQPRTGQYCKWCYSGGEFKYESAEQLIDFCVEHMATEAWPAEQVRAHMEAVVPQLRHWKHEK